MGFSVSASVAIIVVGLAISFTTIYPIADAGYERVTDARSDSTDDLLDQQNTAIELSSLSYDGGAGTLTVKVNNTGTTTLSVSDTDLVVDNEYSEGTTTVDGNAETDLWHPGETLTVEVDGVSARPDRVRLVTEHGISVGGAP